MCCRDLGRRAAEEVQCRGMQVQQRGLRQYSSFKGGKETASMVVRSVEGGGYQGCIGVSTRASQELSIFQKDN